jgi:uncharacterized protein (TIGR03435 family)
LRTLLIDRFKLATHSDVRPVTVYALVAAKPKMARADSSNRTTCKHPTVAANNVVSALAASFTCQNISMAQFADKLQGIAGGYVDRPVVDLTGLDGAWDFTLSFSPVRVFQAGGGQSSDPNGAISLFEALEKQLGLKLEQQKHPMPVLVIDHVNEKPNGQLSFHAAPPATVHVRDGTDKSIPAGTLALKVRNASSVGR